MFRVHDFNARKRVSAPVGTYIPASSTTSAAGGGGGVVTKIYQRDFANGPLVLTQPGKYLVMEDIVFDPFDKFEDIFDSLGSFPDMNHHYVLGYFAAIIIHGSGIDLDLGGFCIRQSHMHNLQQRFFAIIELADRPFMPGQGPADFGAPLRGCTDVRIHNGTLGLSSHHGIHGNNPTNVSISDIVMYDYEVAGITINGGKGIRLTNVEVRQNYRNVLVNGFYSNAVFTLKKLISKERHDTSIGLPAASVHTHVGVVSIHQIMDRLRRSIVDAYADIVREVPVGTSNGDSAFYANPSRLTDGNCYGISLNTTGLLVNEYRDEFVPGSSNISLTNVVISDIECIPSEIPTVTSTPRDQVQSHSNPQTLPEVNKGPFGDVIDYWRCSVNGRFNVDRNPLALAQIMTGTVADTMMDWIRSGASDLETRVNAGDLTVLNNLDIMAHVMKGTIGLFISSIENVMCKSVRIANIRNRSQRGNDQFWTSTRHPYVGARTCGVLVAASKNVQMSSMTIDNIVSDYGEAYGYYLYGACSRVAIADPVRSVKSLRVDNPDYLHPSLSTACGIAKAIGYDATYVG